MSIIFININVSFRDERKQNIPLVICRLCNNQFFADKEKEHSNYCVKKIKAIKD